MKLVGIDSLLKVIQLVLQTSYVEPFKSSSLLIIAKPESAKTESLFQFNNSNDVYFTTEITAKMIIDNILPSASQGKIKHLIIPDILNCIEKQKSTRQQFLNTIKSLMEEGVLKIESYHKRFVSEKPVSLGIITAITTKDFRSERKYLEGIGLLSRFIPFTYDYPMDKIKKIFESIESGHKEENNISYDTKKKNVKIEGDSNLFKNFEFVSARVGEEYSGYGFRIQKNLQQLSKANAYINGRKKITQEDIDDVMKLSNWMNFKFNSL